ncbi:MAG TPA: phenylacetate--CoA ligase [Intrasporangiaceae bacterium]|nr:phenylacetate--CoA ligase [Intrasporangiaceae bacterium]
MPTTTDLDRRITDSVREGARRIPALAARLRAADLDPESVTHEGIAQLPILTKDDLLAAQQAHPPFGGLLSDSADVVRLFQSPGPLYEPQLAGEDPWRWRPALRAAGFGADDVVMNCFGYHLSPAGAMFESGARALGARVVPAGIGSQDLQARAVADLGVSAYVGLPSYLKALMDAFDAAGHDPSRWRLTKALVTAEPLPDSLRSTLRERVPTVLMAYGTAEVGLIGYEDEPGGGLLVPDDIHVEVCDLSTGAPVSDAVGQVVITLLRTEYPLVRFGTGDLSRWIEGADGTRRLAGVLGRAGEAVKVKGMFLHPRQAADVLDPLEEVAAWQFVIDRVDHKDHLNLRIVPANGVADSGALAERVGSAVRNGLRFSTGVEVVDSIPADSGPLVDLRTWD